MCHIDNHRPVELVTPREAFVASLQTVFDSGVNRPANSTALLTDMPTVPRTCSSFNPVLRRAGIRDVHAVGNGANRITFALRGKGS